MALSLPLNTNARFIIKKPSGKNYFRIKENGRTIFTGALDQFYIYVDAKNKSFVIKDNEDTDNFCRILFSDSQYTADNANINDAMQHIAEQIMTSYTLVDPGTFTTDTIVYSTGDNFFITDSYHIKLISRKNVFGLNIQQLVGVKHYELVNVEHTLDIINTNVSFADLTIQLELIFAPLSVGGGSAHVIEDEGTPLADQTNLNFVGEGVAVTDDGGKTVVTIPGIPKITTVQRDAIVGPSEGDEIYNTDHNNKEFYDGTKWVERSSGSVKITENGDASEPTFTAISVSSGLQKIVYVNPTLDGETYFPDTAQSLDAASLFDVITDIYLENPVLGQPQMWRVSMSYSSKNSQNTGNLNLILKNPLSGFERRVGYSLPENVIAEDFITLQINTYADINSLKAPLGTGLGGYELYIENTHNTTMDVVIKDVARLTYNYK